MTDDPLVNAKGLADWLGVSNSAVQDATLRGVLTKAARGRWVLKASVRAYCTHLRKLALGRGTDTPAEAKGRLARAQAELAEMKARRLSGELVELETVRAQWTSSLLRLRAAMLAIPDRVAHLSVADRVALDQEIREALAALADDQSQSVDCQSSPRGDAPSPARRLDHEADDPPTKRVSGADTRL